jgi:hypothetical protein
MILSQRTLACPPLGPLLAVSLAFGQGMPPRTPAEDVGGPEVRTRQGLLPGDTLLFNGWGVTPAGEQVATSDMVLRMVVAPDRTRLAAVGGGYNRHGLTLFDMARKQVAQFLPLPRAWNGLAFSLDGRRIFVSTGDHAEIHVFTYADGEATLHRTVKPDA